MPSLPLAAVVMQQDGSDNPPRHYTDIGFSYYPRMEPS